MLGRWNRGSRTSKNWWKRSIWSYLQHHACHLMSHQRRCQKKKSGILQSAGMVEKELQNDLSTLVRSVKIKSKHLKKWIPRWNEKKPLSVSITSGRRIDCGGWKLQLSKSDWDKSQRLKVFGRLYFDIQFIYLFIWMVVVWLGFLWSSSVWQFGISLWTLGSLDDIYSHCHRPNANFDISEHFASGMSE